MTLRQDLKLIAAMVPEGARVLDLGCGDGALLVAGGAPWGAGLRH